MHRINRINSLGINPTNELEWSIATCSCVQTDLASMLHLTALQYKNPTGTQLLVSVHFSQVEMVRFYTRDTNYTNRCRSNKCRLMHIQWSSQYKLCVPRPQYNSVSWGSLSRNQSLVGLLSKPDETAHKALLATHLSSLTLFNIHTNTWLFQNIIKCQHPLWHHLLYSTKGTSELSNWRLLSNTSKQFLKSVPQRHLW